jgi:hypothetical protein
VALSFPSVRFEIYPFHAEAGGGSLGPNLPPLVAVRLRLSRRVVDRPRQPRVPAADGRRPPPRRRRRARTGQRAQLADALLLLDLHPPLDAADGSCRRGEEARVGGDGEPHICSSSPRAPPLAAAAPSLLAADPGHREAVLLTARRHGNCLGETRLDRTVSGLRLAAKGKTTSSDRHSASIVSSLLLQEIICSI